VQDRSANAAAAAESGGGGTAAERSETPNAGKRSGCIRSPRVLGRVPSTGHCCCYAKAAALVLC